METSRCKVDIPESATPEEAAAIAAAIDAHLGAEPAGSPDAGPVLSTWAFAGRLDALGRRPPRLPDRGPADPWTAAGRLDRF